MVYENYILYITNDINSINKSIFRVYNYINVYVKSLYVNIWLGILYFNSLALKSQYR